MGQSLRRSSLLPSLLSPSLTWSQRRRSITSSSLSAAVTAQSAIDVYALGRSAKTAVTTKSSPAGGAAAAMSEVRVSAQNTCKSGGGGSQTVSLRTSLGKCFGALII